MQPDLGSTFVGKSTIMKEIKFTGYDARKSEIDAKDGELEVCYGLMPDISGTYRNGLECKPIKRLPEGFKAIFVHQIEPHPHLLIASPMDEDGNLTLYHTPYDTESDEVTAGYMRPIGSLKEITCIESMQNILTIGTTDGVRYLVWESGDYHLLGECPELPSIEFGLQKAGHLVTNDTIETTDQTIENSTVGSGSNRVHPLTSEHKAETTNLNAAITQAYADAVKAQVRSKGYFDQPFFIRYGLRMYDGTYIKMSAPILMLPTVLAPKIGINVSTQGDKSVISMDLTGNQYFELRYRIADETDHKWAGIISAIDIFVTQPISTYSAEALKSGYITAYQNVIDAGDDAPHRGRNSRNGEGTFDGLYSLGNDIYAEHYIDENQSNRNVWFIEPNPHIYDDLASADKYYRIASIPFNDVRSTNVFSTVPVCTSDPQGLTRYPLEHAEQITESIIPTALCKFGQRMVMGASKAIISQPYAFTGACAFVGNAADPRQDDVMITVYIKYKGSIYTSSQRCRGMACSLADIFPKYLYYPNPNAYMLTLAQGDNTWRVNLTPHPSGIGAQWLFTDGAAETGAIATAPFQPSDTINFDGRLYLSKIGNPFVVEDSLDLGCKDITAVMRALRAPQSGQFGQYPLYAVSPDGVWMVRIDDSKGSLVNARQISHIGTDFRPSITVMGESIAICNHDGVYVIKGSEVKKISDGLGMHNFDINLLPHAQVLLKEAEAEQFTADTRDVFGRNVMIYDDRRKVLVVVVPDKRVGFVYSLECEAWTVLDLDISHKISIGANEYAIDSEGNIADFSEDSRHCKGLLVTRPLTLNALVTDTDVRGVEILGRIAPKHVKVGIYGTNRLSEWHLIASAEGPVIDEVNSLKYRYHRLVVVCGLSEDEYIYGAQVR